MKFILTSLLRILYQQKYGQVGLKGTGKFQMFSDPTISDWRQIDKTQFKLHERREEGRIGLRSKKLRVQGDARAQVRSESHRNLNS